MKWPFPKLNFDTIAIRAHFNFALFEILHVLLTFNKFSHNLALIFEVFGNCNVSQCKSTLCL